LPTSSTINVFDFVEGAIGESASIKAGVKKEKVKAEKRSRPKFLMFKYLLTILQ
jgi:hypothetical protein